MHPVTAFFYLLPRIGGGVPKLYIVLPKEKAYMVQLDPCYLLERPMKEEKDDDS